MAQTQKDKDQQGNMGQQQGNPEQDKNRQDQDRSGADAGRVTPGSGARERDQDDMKKRPDMDDEQGQGGSKDPQKRNQP